MSKFSGKCDLYDEIYMIGRQEGESELECFQAFKEATGGVIGQLLPIKITKENIDAFIELDKIKYRGFPAGLQKVGKGYSYLGKEYKTFKSFVRDNPVYYYYREIKFDKMIDLVKYYPYIIGGLASHISEKTGKRTTSLHIGSESYVDQRRKETISLGNSGDSLAYYDEELNKEYIRVAKTYY